MTYQRGPLSAGLDESSDEAYRAYSLDSAAPRSERVGVLVLHGFTGSPTSVARWAREFADQGYSVRLPLLPGHGTTPEDMAKSTRAQWIESADKAYRELEATCSKVFVAGLSMGGALSLLMASRHTPAGVMLVNPGLIVDQKIAVLAPVLKYAVKFVDSIGDDIALPGVTERAYSRTPIASVAQLRALMKETREGLGQVSCPVLAFISETDNVLTPASLGALEKSIPSEQLRVVRLAESRHVATMDHDAELIFRRSLAFVEELSA